MIDSIFIYLFPVKERKMKHSDGYLEVCEKRKMKHSDGYLEVCENYFSGLLSSRVILMPSDMLLTFSLHQIFG